VTQCKGPHRLGNNLWPFHHCMKKNGASAGDQTPDEALGNTVLPMSANSTKGGSCH
jgi:hypothetical protein